MFLTQQGDIDHCNQMIDVIIAYLSEFENDNFELNQAYCKLQEASFWLASAYDY